MNTILHFSEQYPILVCWCLFLVVVYGYISYDMYKYRNCNKVEEVDE